MLACLPDISHHIPAVWVWTALFGILRTYCFCGLYKEGEEKFLHVSSIVESDRGQKVQRSTKIASRRASHSSTPRRA